MSLIALRKFSVEDRASGERWDFDQGDTIPTDAQRALPAGRLESLRNSRHVEVIGEDVESVTEALVALAARVAELEDALAALTPVQAAPEPTANAPKAKTTERKAA